MDILTQLNEYRDARRNAFVSAIVIKNAGGHIGGVFGVDVPREILWAADIVPVDIYSIDSSNISAAAKVLTTSYCDLIRASYGYAITDKCPLTHCADIIIGSGKCKEKLAMLYKMAEMKKLYILPESSDICSLAAAFRDFSSWLEQQFDIQITDHQLAETIKKYDSVSRKVAELFDLFMSGSLDIGSDDFYSIVYGSQFIFNLDESIARLTVVTDSLGTINDQASRIPKEDPIRVLIIGAPQTGIREKVLQALDRMDKNINALAFSGCEGQNYRLSGMANDPYTALAEKYLSLSPSEEMKVLVAKYHPSAIINVALHGCHSLFDSYGCIGLPQLSLITDYENDDAEVIYEQLKSFINSL